MPLLPAHPGEANSIHLACDLCCSFGSGAVEQGLQGVERDPTDKPENLVGGHHARCKFIWLKPDGAHLDGSRETASQVTSWVDLLQREGSREGWAGTRGGTCGRRACLIK